MLLCSAALCPTGVGASVAIFTTALDGEPDIVTAGGANEQLVPAGTAPEQASVAVPVKPAIEVSIRLADAD